MTRRIWGGCSANASCENCNVKRTSIEIEIMKVKVKVGQFSRNELRDLVQVTGPAISFRTQLPHWIHTYVWKENRFFTIRLSEFSSVQSAKVLGGWVHFILLPVSIFQQLQNNFLLFKDYPSRSKSSTLKISIMKLKLEITAQLENIKQFKAGEDFYYYLKVRCTNCNHETGKWHGVSLNEEFPSRNSGKSSSHFVMNCHECKRESTLQILADTIKPYAFDESKNESYQQIVIFEARGLEPVDFEAREGWTAEGPSKTFNNISFESGPDWSDYDDNANEAVSILSLKHRFLRA